MSRLWLWWNERADGFVVRGFPRGLRRVHCHAGHGSTVDLFEINELILGENTGPKNIPTDGTVSNLGHPSIANGCNDVRVAESIGGNAGQLLCTFGVHHRVQIMGPIAEPRALEHRSVDNGSIGQSHQAHISRTKFRGIIAAGAPREQGQYTNGQCTRRRASEHDYFSAVHCTRSSSGMLLSNSYAWALTSSRSWSSKG